MICVIAPMIEVARGYDHPRKSAKSGLRYLVERLWPRGMKKETLQLNGWLKDVAPSNTLRNCHADTV